MIKKTLHFSNPAYLSLQLGQMVIEYPFHKDISVKEAAKSIAIEDIGVVILENPQITITHSCMAALMENNAVLVACNQSHLPVSFMLPIEGHNTQNERFRYQIEASKPLKKQLWQQTVQAKITNQASVLKRNGINIENMTYWAKSVRTGDPDNYEARAAAFYWKEIFEEKAVFKRNREGDPPNNLLNYGYAILRAIVARSLVSSGLLPTLGIHHHNKYNAYCLADDIMEPYRPYVDTIVIKILKNEPSRELNLVTKAKLLSIGSLDVDFEDTKRPLLVGVQLTTASLASCYEGSSRKIYYPNMA